MDTKEKRCLDLTQDDDKEIKKAKVDNTNSTSKSNYITLSSMDKLQLFAFLIQNGTSEEVANKILICLNQFLKQF